MSTSPQSRSRSAFSPANLAYDLAYVAVFAALIAAFSLLPAIPVGAFGVPITLQTLAVSLAALCLGPWRGAGAVALYVLVGAAGLPIFAQGRAGVAVLLGPTGGYLLAFILSTIVLGYAARFIVGRGLTRLTALWLFIAGIVVRFAIIWPIGVAGIARALGKPLGSVWLIDMPFWPGDILKLIVAVFIALAVHKAFPRLLFR